MKVPERELVAVIEPRNGADFHSKLESLKNDTDLRVVVADCRESETNSLRLPEIEKAIRSFPLPLVLVVSGNVEGWLAGVLLAAPICFADPDTEFVFEDVEEIKSVAGSRAAAAIRTTSMKYQSARDLGLINDSRTHESGIDAALAFANRASGMAPLAVRACLDMVRKSQDRELEKGTGART